ncbi:UvrB/UvrC motif-containing protein [Peptoniphilus stercorisuis]|uniref:Protein arginine kinase activator n=1 Tax=Peptoniphilus stercorisuis TaxID=1436965 RepID=A0ABS4KGH1_9FIRM|nr:UvrB/UvrC motif-containing protein [Peptoniphilus stercorisuis]MBP2025729.1 protein arginine kinase activator [Peptoniphilus stercorisuis]
MLCDSCKKRDAIIAYTKMQNNDVEIVHLCAKCAEEKMKEDLDFNNIVTEKVENFIGELFKLTNSIDEKELEKACSYCETSLKDMVKGKTLGCEHCYDEFREEINGILLNLSSSTNHKGKIPKSAGEKSIKKREEIKLLNRLNVAIELEEYEEAAKLRDEINMLKEG